MKTVSYSSHLEQLLGTDVYFTILQSHSSSGVQWLKPCSQLIFDWWLLKKFTLLWF